MNPDSAHSETAPARIDRRAGEHSVAVIAFIILCAVASLNQWRVLIPRQDWLCAAVAVMGLVAAVASFAPVLPWPNVLLAGALAAFIGGMAEAVSGATGFPFGRGEFMPGSGPLFLGLFPWWFPFAWATIALSARGTARLILHRSRQHPLQGYRVIALAAVLGLAGTISLELFSTHAAHFWTTEAAPVLPWVSRLMLHLLIQVTMTPLLLDKFPGPRPPNVRPLVVWTTLNAVLLLGLFCG
jgi:uncharacterized membrane protein